MKQQIMEALESARSNLDVAIADLEILAAGEQIWVSVRAEQDHILCTVRDEGPGLSAEEQARLFQKSVRLSNDTNMISLNSSLD